MKTTASPPDGPQGHPATPRDAGSLKHRAYAELKDQILSGALPPGTFLSERQLALGLKMSKTPVHAALERLEVDGLVSVAAQQGIVVRAMTPREIAEHYEIREALETLVVARLADRLTAEQALRLKRNIAENRRVVRRSDLEGNIRLDSEFHTILCESHGNEEISRAMARIRDKVRGVIREISSRIPHRMAASLSEHEAIAAAVLAGDGPAAKELMAAHLRAGLRCIFDQER